MNRDELRGWLRLCLTPSVGIETSRRLLAEFGLPEQIFEQPASALAGLVTPAQLRALSSPPESLETQLETTLAWLQQPPPGRRGARRIVVLGDGEYPVSLLRTADPPLMLYLMGHGLLQEIAPATRASNQHGPSLNRALAIVGSRNPTPQGESNARQFARSLAGSGLTVVSGLALGVDGAAHGGALEAGLDPEQRLATVAVVGTGLDRVYPKQHLELARRITEHGLLISEYPLGTPPLAANFPRRNRLIAGLSQGTLVVEAALQSGSLITARLALEQGKDVFAIPGSIHSPQSRGCHALIKDGAKLVETAQDILEELGAPVPAPTPSSWIDSTPDTGPEAALLGWLGHDPVGLDELVARSGIEAAQWQVNLLNLEIEGHIARLPGGLYQRQKQH